MRAVELTYTFFSPDTFLESGGKRGKLGKGVCAKLCKAHPSFAKLIPALPREEERPPSPPRSQDRMWEDPRPHSSAPPSPELSLHLLYEVLPVLGVRVFSTNLFSK